MRVMLQRNQNTEVGEVNWWPGYVVSVEHDAVLMNSNGQLIAVHRWSNEEAGRV